MSEYCPTRGGTYTAYEPEFLNEDGKWCAIQVQESPYGIPGSKTSAGINSVLGLFSYEQAWALAWQYAAVQAATSVMHVLIRVAQYEVRYDLKAKRLEMALTHAE